MHRNPPPGRRWLRPRYLLLLASILFSLLLAEGLLRLLYVATYSGTLEDLNSRIPDPGAEVPLGEILALSDSDRLIYRLKPNLDVNFKGARVRTNRLGFREAALPETREPGTIRIAGIGDSVMFGQGVEESERYMDVLEARLNRDFPATPWQTITIAAPGYNLVMEVEALERYALSYEPDLVIYGFIANDFCLPNFVSRRHSVWSFESFIRLYWIGRRDSLIPRRRGTRDDHGVSPAALRTRDRELFDDAYCSAENVLPDYRHLAGEESFYQALDDLARIGRERGMATIFLSYGSIGDADKIPLPDGMIFIDLHNRYQSYLKEKGYRRVAESDLVLSRADHHPSVKAHRMIGTALADRLVELGLVESMSARRQPPGPARR